MIAPFLEHLDEDLLPPIWGLVRVPLLQADSAFEDEKGVVEATGASLGDEGEPRICFTSKHSTAHRSAGGHIHSENGRNILWSYFQQGRHLFLVGSLVQNFDVECIFLRGLTTHLDPFNINITNDQDVFLLVERHRKRRRKLRK